MRPDPKPLTDLQIKRMKPGGRKEGQHLDFKREWWFGKNAGEEAAKDVAALANAEGGDLIVGADEEDTKFKGFHDWNKPGSKVHLEEPVEEILKLISPYLRPRDFVEKVRARMVDVAPFPVLVVTVPKSAFLVGCASGPGHESKIGYPIRTETRTDHIEPGEVMRRARDNDSWKRFRFGNLLRRDLRVKLFADMVTKFPGQMGPEYVSSLGGAAAPTWTIQSVEDDAVVLRSEYVRDRFVLPHDKHYRYAPIPEATLTIPYELIRTVWVAAVLTVEDLHVMLDTSVGVLLEYPFFQLYLRNPDLTLIEEDPVHWTDDPNDPNSLILVGPEGAPCTPHPWDPPEMYVLRIPRPKLSGSSMEDA